MGCAPLLNTYILSTNVVCLFVFFSRKDGQSLIYLSGKLLACLWSPWDPGSYSSGFSSQESPAHTWTAKQPHHRNIYGEASRVSTQNYRTAILGSGSLILTCHGFPNFSEAWSFWVPSTPQVLKICGWFIWPMFLWPGLGAQSVLALSNMGRLLREQASTQAMTGKWLRDLV